MPNACIHATVNPVHAIQTLHNGYRPLFGLVDPKQLARTPNHQDDIIRMIVQTVTRIESAFNQAGMKFRLESERSPNT